MISSIQKRHENAADYELRPWKGYTMDQLIVRQIVVKAKIEIEKDRLANSLKGMKKSSPLAPAGILRSIFTAISAADYVFWGIKIFRKLRPLLRRK